MRVISGKAKGLKLLSVPGDTTRPILDRVKTALFDIVRPSLAGRHVLDLFAGSGSVGIEALSQGAAKATLLDISQKAIDTIRKNLAHTGLAAQAEVKRMDAFRFLRMTSHSFDFIYVAPPQYKSLWTEAMHHIAERPQLVNKSGMIVVQIDPREYEQLDLADFQQTRREKYSNTLLIFYTPREQSRSPT